MAACRVKGWPSITLRDIKRLWALVVLACVYLGVLSHLGTLTGRPTLDGIIMPTT